MGCGRYDLLATNSSLLAFLLTSIPLQEQLAAYLEKAPVEGQVGSAIEMVARSQSKRTLTAMNIPT